MGTATLDDTLEAGYCPTAGCGRLLIVGPENEPFWCEECCLPFQAEDVRAASIWRRMSRAERESAIIELGERAIEEYRISSAQLDEIVKQIRARETSPIVDIGDVAPTKSTLPSLARGINDVGALRELIDNALDSAHRKSVRPPVHVIAKFNTLDGSIVIRDNAGGMDKEDLLRCLRLGSVRDNHEDNVIGRFGVGAKEAIYHFGHEVTIRTRALDADAGFLVEVPEAWLRDPSWNVEIRTSSEIRPGSTEFRIGALTKFEFDYRRIRTELWTTYRKLLEDGKLVITVNEHDVSGVDDAILLYLPELYPRKYRFEAGNAHVELTVSVLKDSPHASGIFFTAFGRQFAHWQWNDARARMLLSKVPQHRLHSHFRVEIDFAGRIEDLPINANKDEVEPNNEAFRVMAPIVQALCQPYLDSVTWLSQEGNMRFVADRYAGPDKAHPLAKVDPPESDLGKVYRGKIVPKHLRADVDAFKKQLNSDIAATNAASAGPPPMVHLPPPSSTPVTKPEPRGDVQGDLPGPAAQGSNGRASQNTDSAHTVVPQVVVKIEARDLDRNLFRVFQAHIRTAAKSLGIDVAFPEEP